MLKSVVPTAIGVDFQYHFYVPTWVKFKFANKIEAVYERSHVIIKVEPRSTARLISTLYILPLFYLRD